jgi:hypothetical protein
MTSKRYTLDFSDLQPIEIPFKVNGVSYVLREASGGAVKVYTNERMKRITFGPTGKVVSTRDLAEVDYLLVSLCVKTSEEKDVSQATVESWPNTMFKRILETTKEISGINKEESESLLDMFVRALAENANTAPTSIDILRTWTAHLPDTFEPLKEALKDKTPKE